MTSPISSLPFSLQPFLPLPHTFPTQRLTLVTPPPPELTWHPPGREPSWDSEVAPRPRLFTRAVVLQRLWYLVFQNIGKCAARNTDNIKLNLFLILWLILDNLCSSTTIKEYYLLFTPKKSWFDIKFSFGKALHRF